MEKSILQQASHHLFNGFVLTNIGSVLNLLFQLHAARTLEPADYGALGALLGLLTMLILPGQGLQMLLSRRGNQLLAQGDGAKLTQIYRRGVWTLLLGLGAMLLFGGVLGNSLKTFYHFESAWGVRAVFAVGGCSLIYYWAMGALQAHQEFGRYGLSQIISAAGRLVLGGAALSMGWDLASTILSLAVMPVLLVIWISFRLGKPIQTVDTLASKPTTDQAGPAPLLQEATNAVFKEAPPMLSHKVALGRELLSLIAIFGGLLVVLMLDIAFVQHYFGGEGRKEPGLYQAAASIGRTILYLPLTFSMITFAKTARARARGKNHKKLLYLNIALTAFLTTVSWLIVGIFAEPLLQIYGGGDRYLAAAELLRAYRWPMAILGLANILVHYGVAQEKRGFALLIPFSVLLMILLLVIHHPSPMAMIDVLTAISVLLCAASIFLLWLPGRPAVDIEQ